MQCKDFLLPQESSNLGRVLKILLPAKTFKKTSSVITTHKTQSV